jgi:hypothetical protein
VKITFTLEEIKEAEEEQAGYCIKCGNFQHGVEPDARKYECEECGLPAVYGTFELYLMGVVK